jgi:hypothetical protein
VTIDSSFEQYLRHFRHTIPVLEFVERGQTARLLALRHDIDYDLDLALEGAGLEARLGLRASFFVLHTADYFSDPDLFAKCRQIHSYGHEVGLHTNLLAEWYEGRIDDVGAALHGLLAKFRQEGIGIRGVAAHGDQLCYRASFTNYWLFSELRPGDPQLCEAGITAEGTPAGAGEKSISYQDGLHWLKRPDGARFDYWSLRLADFGLAYEASRIGPDGYL